MKYLYILFLPVLLLLTACSSSDDPVEIHGDGDSMLLSFSMVTTGKISESRTDAQGHGETDSEFRDFEDGIDIGDLGMFVFAKVTGSTSDYKLVYKLTNLLKSDDARISIVGGNGNYLVNLMIRKEDLKKTLDGHEIRLDGNSYISFRIMILANCSSVGADDTAAWDAIVGDTFPDVISELNEWSFPMSGIYDETGGPGVETFYKKHCPMFGTNEFSVTEAALYDSRPEDRIFLGEINLLRALAKVRVVDNIQGKDAQGYPRIIAAEFLSSQSQTRQLPAGAVNYTDGQQVHTPNIYEQNPDLTLMGTYKLGTLPEAWTITPSSQRTGNVFIGFVPEQPIGLPNNSDEGMPVFHITIANRKADNTLEYIDYYVPMTSYNGVDYTVDFDFGLYILRNHIYTLSVDFGATLKIQVDVVPYRSCVLEPYFGLDPNRPKN